MALQSIFRTIKKRAWSSIGLKIHGELSSVKGVCLTQTHCRRPGEDPLEAFNRMIREKEMRAKRREEERRRELSPSRSRSRSRTRTRTRSRTPRVRARSRASSRPRYSRFARIYRSLPSREN